MEVDCNSAMYILLLPGGWQFREATALYIQRPS